MLVLNLQAIHAKTLAEAFCMMDSGAARGLEMQSDDAIVPGIWDAWLALSVRDQDRAVGSPRQAVRCPTVTVSSNDARVPMRRLGFKRSNL